jgi:hypothetical protein
MDNRVSEASAKKRDLDDYITEETIKYDIITKMMEETHDMIINCKLIMYDIKEGEKYRKDITEGFQELSRKLENF